jgi:hypothetical protein
MTALLWEYTARMDIENIYKSIAMKEIYHKILKR